MFLFGWDGIVYAPLSFQSTFTYILGYSSHERRYKKALATFLGKEIARSLYQQIDPTFSYDVKKYHPGDAIDEIVVKSPMEMFRALRKIENKNSFIEEEKESVW